jgi:hypothetical protein
VKSFNAVVDPCVPLITRVRFLDELGDAGVPEFGSEPEKWLLVPGKVSIPVTLDC